MNLIIEQFPAREDNFGVLVHDPETGDTLSIDAPEAEPIRSHLAARGWRLTDIFTTHHHADHVEGNLALKQEFGCTITGPTAEADRIPGIDRRVGENDTLSFGGLEVSILETPGHTLGHISYWIPSASVAFVADTLFAMGCGRVFEGTPEMMWRSLEKLLALPDDTTCYCGHEYTESNAKFAVTIEPDNARLVARAAEVVEIRKAGQPTLPTTIKLEKETNPFLRVNEPSIRNRLGMETASAAEIFAEIRRRKDNF